MCAAAYTLRWEALQQQASTFQLAAVLAQANGAQVDIPDFDQIRRDFDQALAQDPAGGDAADDDTLTKLRALGLRPALAGR